MDQSKLKKISKTLRVVFWINLAARIINTLFVTLLMILELAKAIKYKSFEEVNYYPTVYSAIKLGLSSWCLSELRSINIVCDNSSDTLRKLKKVLIYSGINVAIFILLFIICIATGIMEIARVMGSAGLGFISFICGAILACILYKNVKRLDAVTQYGGEKGYLEYLQAEQEKFEEQTRQNTVTNLLEKIGRKFFVKYYEKLRNWSIPDIVDEIEESYSEESKLARIKEAKKNLNKVYKL